MDDWVIARVESVVGLCYGDRIQVEENLCSYTEDVGGHESLECPV